MAPAQREGSTRTTRRTKTGWSRVARFQQAARRETKTRPEEIEESRLRLGGRRAKRKLTLILTGEQKKDVPANLEYGEYFGK